MTATALAEQLEPKPRPRFEPGWHKDIPNEDYHRSGGSSSSNLKVLLQQTGAHLQYAKTHPREPSASMGLGTAVHTLVLEPDEFSREIAVRPEGLNLRTNIGKQEMEVFLAHNEGKTIITQEQFEVANLMTEQVRQHPIASALLEDIVVESSIFWWYRSMDPTDDERYKELVKVRPDALSRAHPVVIDLKTVKDGSYTGFIRSIQDYYYHMSAAMYLEGVNQCKPLLEEMGYMAYLKFIFVCVENFAPYKVSVYELSPEYLQIGKQLYRYAMQRLKDAREAEWPGYPDEVRVIEPPAYASRFHIV